MSKKPLDTRYAAHTITCSLRANPFMYVMFGTFHTVIVWYGHTETVLQIIQHSDQS